MSDDNSRHPHKKSKKRKRDRAGSDGQAAADVRPAPAVVYYCVLGGERADVIAAVEAMLAALRASQEGGGR
jgi:hypothetical protein